MHIPKNIRTFASEIKNKQKGKQVMENKNYYRFQEVETYQTCASQYAYLRDLYKELAKVVATLDGKKLTRRHNSTLQNVVDSLNDKADAPYAIDITSCNVIKIRRLTSKPWIMSGYAHEIHLLTDGQKDVDSPRTSDKVDGERSKQELEHQAERFNANYENYTNVCEHYDEYVRKADELHELIQRYQNEIPYIIRPYIVEQGKRIL